MPVWEDGIILTYTQWFCNNSNKMSQSLTSLPVFHSLWVFACLPSTWLLPAPFPRQLSTVKDRPLPACSPYPPPPPPSLFLCLVTFSHSLSLDECHSTCQDPPSYLNLRGTSDPFDTFWGYIYSDLSFSRVWPSNIVQVEFSLHVLNVMVCGVILFVRRHLAVVCRVFFFFSLMLKFLTFVASCCCFFFFCLFLPISRTVTAACL